MAFMCWQPASLLRSFSGRQCSVTYQDTNSLCTNQNPPCYVHHAQQFAILFYMYLPTGITRLPVLQLYTLYCNGSLCMCGDIVCIYRYIYIFMNEYHYQTLRQSQVKMSNRVRYHHQLYSQAGSGSPSSK